MDRKLLSIILLGLSFMLVYTATQTMLNIQKTLLDSVHTEDPNFNGNIYTGMTIMSTTFAVVNWLTPSAISLTGPKTLMVYGGLTYLFFIASYLWPQAWLLYFAYFLIGTGGAMMWTAQGNYFTLNSTPETISRNAGIFWALLQMSMFTGNTFVFFEFEGLTHIDKETRTMVISILCVINAIGVMSLFALPMPKPDEKNVIEEQLGPIKAFKSAIRLLFTKNMMLLSFTFLYAGAEVAFFISVYSSSIGFTNKFGDQAKQLVGLSGIFIGVGEVIGGALFGVLGAKFARWGRDPIVIGGCVIHLCAFLLILINLPNSSTFSGTDEDAFIDSSATLAILCSFLLGLGDACYLTQLFSILGGVYEHNSASAFAVFKFIDAIGVSIYFSFATAIGLYAQLGILIFLAILGTATFVYVERNEKNKIRDEKIENGPHSQDQVEKF